MAFMLLAACNLNEIERKLVMSSMDEVKYDTMKSALKRIFSSEIAKNPLSDTKEMPLKNEPVFYGEENHEHENVLYSKEGYKRGRGRSSIRSRGRRGIGRGLKSNQNNWDSSKTRKTNPVGRDGEVSRCLICDSKFHWARDCPDAYENDVKKERFEKREIENSDEKHEECVNLSLIVGFGNRSEKLNVLVNESKGYAVLDTGCSTTVCGEEWLKSYVENLSDYDQSKVREIPSSSTFTFGDGVTVQSKKKIVLPCYLGNLRSEITTDLVECKIPLLLSNRSMKRAKLLLNFSDDTAKIGCETIKLRTSSSGHYMLPLSM